MKYLFVFMACMLTVLTEAQQTAIVDFKTVNAQIVPVPEASKVSGKVDYSLEIVNNTDSIYLDAINMTFSDVRLNEEKVTFHNDLKKIWIKSKFKKNETYKLTFNYTAYPKKALYVVKRNEEWQVWTQGQGKYTSNWLPSIDDTNDKIEFDLSVTYQNGYEVVANGNLLNKAIGETTTKWHYNMQKPMPSYLAALAIGNYSKSELTSKSGIPITHYYYPEDSAKVEPTYRYTKQLFDFLESEIGYPYPWQNYKQVPVKDFLYSGMENTSLTIFSDDFLIDNTAFVDKNYVNVNAHELAHQWFGNLVTATQSKHHWLQEGFATYYALLAERDVFGDDYYYFRLYEYMQELKAQESAGTATALLDPKASSVTFYKRGAWALHCLKEEVGEKAFKIAVKNYLEKHQFKNVETQDFITEVEATSGKRLNTFVKKWLKALALPIDDMAKALHKNETSAFLLTIEDTSYLSYRTDDNNHVIPSSITTSLPTGFQAIKTAVLLEALNKPDYPGYQSLIADAFASNTIEVRQVLAQNLTEIPSALKKDYETLLNDNSYVTIESALYNLWNNFPQERHKYLDKTAAIHGFNDKNIRTLWLALALNTKGYNEPLKQGYYNELVAYTSSEQGFQLRKNAFSYLGALNAFNNDALTNLIAATTHHNWRFNSFAKNVLKSLSENEKYKDIISNLQQQ